MVNGQTTSWDAFREEMPITRRWVYLDHAAVAPLPQTTRYAIQGWLDEATEQGDPCWPGWCRQVQNARLLAARLIGAHAEEIALVHNTTEGISLVAEGFPWAAGDNVVTLANEFPSNQYPWLNLARRGVDTRRVPVQDGHVDLDRVAEQIDPRTRMVAISWVGYASGWRIDPAELAELAHQRGALLMLDAIQGLGVFELDVEQSGVDFLAADGHKWLLGPEGAGVLYIRREHLDVLQPMNVGWHSVAHAHDYAHIELDLRPDAARYEGGSQNMAGFIGLAASLELLTRLGAGPRHSAIGQRVLEITDLACQRLEELGARIHSDRSGPRRSGIISFDLEGLDARRIRQDCQTHEVILGYRDGHIRISPHAYNNEQDIDRLIEALEQIRGRD